MRLLAGFIGKVIEKELDDIRYKNEHYRPSNTKCISESEKERLNQVFTYKGGKALPEELTNPVSLAPYEIKAQQKERNRINEVKSKRGILKETASAGIGYLLTHLFTRSLICLFVSAIERTSTIKTTNTGRN